MKDIPRPAGELLHLIERTPRAADVLAGLEVFKAARAEAIGVRRQSVPLAGRSSSSPGGGARTAAQTGDTAFAIPTGAAGLATSTPNARSASACKVPTAAASLSSSTLNSLQDRLVRLKRIQDEIRDAGIDTLDEDDASMREALMHGRKATRLRAFRNDPVRELIQTIAREGLTLRDIYEHFLAVLRSSRPAPRRSQAAEDRPP